MSHSRSLRRKLNPSRVRFAQQVQIEKVKIARQVVIERAKKDAEFAADVLKAVGESLPDEVKAACEESINEKAKQKLMEETNGLVSKWEKTGLLNGIKSDIENTNMSVLIESQQKQLVEGCCGGCDKTHEMVPMQTDGGGEILVNPTELPDYPTGAILDEFPLPPDLAKHLKRE